MAVSLVLLCRALRLPEPVAEFRFAPPRRWRFDYAWPAHQLALEVQGGIFTSGRHTRGAALVKEHEKLNEAAIRGWRLLYVTPQQLANGEAALIVEAAVRRQRSTPQQMDDGEAVPIATRAIKGGIL
jgi:hypothetical protein